MKIYKAKKHLGLKNFSKEKFSPESKISSFIRPKKALGQNFLKSEIALKKIVEAGEIKPSDIVLEIGPGKGALTEKLLGSGCKVIAVEKDRELVEFLKEKFSAEIKSEKLILINEDILKFKVSTLLRPCLKSFKIIANIPYNITGAILKKFLTAENQPERVVLMLQKEVAQRILGRRENYTSLKLRDSRNLRMKMGGKKKGKESLLSISVKAYGEPELVMKVEKRYFSPPPKVDSAVIAIKNISREFFTPTKVGTTTRAGDKNHINEEKFWKIVKAGFSHKRKKLSGNLKRVISLEKSSQDAILGSILDKRAEDLTLSDWIALAKM